MTDLEPVLKDLVLEIWTAFRRNPPESDECSVLEGIEVGVLLIAEQLERLNNNLEKNNGQSTNI